MSDARNGDLIRLLDSTRTVEFVGVQIAKTTTERPELLRWTEMELYTITEGERAGGYVFRVTGRSVVYHDGRNACGKGVPELARNLVGFGQPEGDYDAMPCPVCRPKTLDELGADDRMMMEKDWHRVEVCATAADVYTGLSAHASRAGAQAAPGQRPTLNHPAQRLLEQASLRDPAFAAEQVVERL